MSTGWRRGRGVLRGPGRAALQRRDRPHAHAVRPRHRRAQLLCDVELRHLRQGVRSRRSTVRCAPLATGSHVEANACSGCPTSLRERQRDLRADRWAARGRPVRRRSGALRLVREDVGRHNAVDKVVGALALGEPAGRADPPGVRTPLVRDRPEGRGRAHPDRLRDLGAVEPRRPAPRTSSGVTAVGFLRPGGFNIYSHPERVLDGSGRLMARVQATPSRPVGRSAAQRHRADETQPLPRDAADGLGEPRQRCRHAAPHPAPRVCATGARSASPGLHDWTIDGVHLCTTRLALLQHQHDGRRGPQPARRRRVAAPPLGSGASRARPARLPDGATPRRAGLHARRLGRGPRARRPARSATPTPAASRSS